MFEYRVPRRISMSKKDNVTRKWTNYIMRKIEEISAYSGYNRVKTKTQNTLDS